MNVRNLSSFVRNKALSFAIFLPLLLSGKTGWSLEVCVSIPPQAFLVENITQGQVSAVVFIPQKADPHTFEISPSTMRLLSRADAYFFMGLEIEKKIRGKISGLNGKLKVFDTQRGVRLRSYKVYEGKGIDPHFWLDPTLFLVQAKNILSDLSSLDPKKKDFYEKNFFALEKRLLQLDRKIGEILFPYKKRVFFVYHPAFGYFAERYDLVQIPFEFEGKEISTERLIRTIEKAKKEKATFILSTPGSKPKNLLRIAQTLNASIFIVDPLEKNYIDNLERLAVLIKKGFER